MRTYLSGRKARAIHGKREESKVGLVTRFYTGDWTKWRHVIPSEQTEAKSPYRGLLPACFAAPDCRAQKRSLRIHGFWLLLGSHKANTKICWVSNRMTYFNTQFELLPRIKAFYSNCDCILFDSWPRHQLFLLKPFTFYSVLLDKYRYNV